MNIALIIVIIYMFSLLFVSWYSTKLQKEASSKSFLFADNQLTWPLIGVMIAGLAIGGASTVGIAQNAYTAGLSAGWYDVAWAGGALFTGVFLAEKIRKSSYKTINQMWGVLFGEGFQGISVIIQIGINVVIVALQIVAGGAILTALLPQYFTLGIGLIVSAFMFCAIAVIGGLWAASLSNIVNIIVIYIGIIVGVITVVNGFGGFEEINLTLPAGISGDGSHWYSLVKGMGMSAILAWFITMLIQGIPNAAIMQNIISAKSPKEAKKGVIFAAIIMIPAGFISALFGIMAASKFPGLESSTMALPSVVVTVSPWVAGILLSGLWAADVSTATGLMVAISTMTTQDVMVKYFKPDMDDKQQLTCSKIIIVLTTLIAYLAATQVSSVLGSLMMALTLFAPYAIVLTAVYLFPKMVKQSTGWITFLAGVVTFIIVQFLVPSLRIAGQSIYTVAIVSLIAFFISQFDKRQAPIEKIYKEVKEIV